MDITHLGTVFTVTDEVHGVITTFRVLREDRGDQVAITTEDMRGQLLALSRMGLEDLIGWLEKLRREGY